MKPGGAKQKGKRLEQKFASEYRRKIGDAVRTPGSGSGKVHKDDVWTKYFSVECKNQEKMSFWTWWQQIWSHRSLGKPPILAFTANHRPIIVAMELNDWLDLVKEAKVELPEALEKLRS